MKHISIGIIGTGRFASVLRKLFSSDMQFVLKQSSRSKIVDRKVIFPFEDVVNCDIVFPAVPISDLPKVLQRCVLVLSKESNPLFVSICSVMEQPEKWMKKILPKHVDIVVTHPVFGPQSTKQGTIFSGLPIAWHPVRIRHKARIEVLETFLQHRGLNVLRITPKEHDRIMARSQAVSFLFGKIGIALKLQSTMLDTKGFTAILQNQAIVENDSHELFLNIFQYNRHTQQILVKTQHIFTEISKEIKRKHHE
ncbi:MAG: prephenate dehydrogenase/arogenate dehydrogenase family protein [Patescibacteria group bacterium]